jgi:tetratricopeptide (TPR) repeat protein
VFIQRKITVICCLLAISTVFSGCAASNIVSIRKDLAQNPESGILIDAPFVRQEKAYCGPAALASVFAFWGKPQSQEKIAQAIFSNDLKGVLNIDLERYAKDNGFWAKAYTADIEELKDRLKTGMPVIVMQKLRPFVLNRYHYTVVVGFDESKKIFIEHTGQQANAVRSYNGFKRNWYQAGNWMLEIMPLEKADEDVSLEENVELGVLLEKQGNWDASLKRYYDALKENAKTPMAFFNIGNVYLRIGHLEEAEESYRKAIELKKDFPDCYNNMACLFIRKKDFQKAHIFADKALAFPSEKRFYYLDTKAQIFYAQSKFEDAIDTYYKALSQKESISEAVLESFCSFWREKFSLIGKPDIVPPMP